MHARRFRDFTYAHAAERRQAAAKLRQETRLF
jgi:hypothetical protein